MDLITLLMLALGLSMDAFAVSISNTMCYRGLGPKWRVGSALAFGVFQGLMPIIGFFAGRIFAGVVQAVDHWVALVLLGFIGGKMIVEAVKALRRPESCPEAPQAFGMKTMLVQAVATSIDALAVGVSFAALSLNIWGCAALIALITFACCLAGGLIGKISGALLGDWAQIFGGLILVGIGVKIFIEHMFGL